MKLLYIIFLALSSGLIYGSDAKKSAEQKYRMEENSGRPEYEDFMTDCEKDFARLWREEYSCETRLSTMKSAYINKFKAVYPYSSLASAESSLPLEDKAMSELEKYFETLKGKQYSIGQANQNALFESALTRLKTDRTNLAASLKEKQKKCTKEYLLREKKLALETVNAIEARLAMLSAKDKPKS